jgi:hypothetical protein
MTPESYQLKTPFYFTHLLKNSDGERGNKYRILVVNNTETALRKRPTLSYSLKQWVPHFGTDAATVVISAIQKCPFGVTIKNKPTGSGKILCYIFST